MQSERVSFGVGILFFAIQCLTVVADDAHSPVVALGDNNFTSILDEAGPDVAWLVNFHAPWCIYCQELAPLFEAAAHAAASQRLVRLATVDATLAPVLAQKYFITKHPTLLQIKGPACLPIEASPAKKNGIFTAGRLQFLVQTMAKSSWTTPPDRLVELQPGTLSDFVDAENTTMVTFHAGNQRSNHVLVHELRMAAQRLWHRAPKPLRIAVYNCTSIADEDDECQKFNIRLGEPPALIVFQASIGQYYRWDIEHTASAIEQSLRLLTSTPSVELTTAHAVRQVAEAIEIAVVGFFVEGDTDGVHIYSDAIRKLVGRGYTFYHILNESVINLLIQQDFPSIRLGDVVVFGDHRLRSKYEPTYERYPFFTSKNHVGKLATFIENAVRPLVGFKTKDAAGSNRGTTYDDIFPRIEIYFDADYTDAPADTELTRLKILDIAKDYNDSEVTFCFGSDTEWESLLRLEYGISDIDSEWAVVGIAGGERRGAKYVMPNTMQTREFVEAFATGALFTQLEPYIKSERVPKKEFDGRVRLLVGSNFENVVFDKSKDVVVQVCVPWSHHCKSLASKWRLLGEKLKDIPSIIVAKMTGEVNQLPHLCAHDTYPNIMIVPAGSSHPVFYDNDLPRTVSNFLRWIQSNTRRGDVPQEQLLGRTEL